MNKKLTLLYAERVKRVSVKQIFWNQSLELHKNSTTKNIFNYQVLKRLRVVHVINLQNKKLQNKSLKINSNKDNVVITHYLKTKFKLIKRILIQEKDSLIRQINMM